MNNNIYLLDKPQGITSFDVVQSMRKSLKLKRIGHAGTLDPFATGLLILATGKFTRIADCFHRYDKEYLARIRLGVCTDTDDMTGRIIEETNPGPLDRKRIEEVLKPMIGTIQQVPPAISAKRVNGKRLYDMNRAGVRQAPRPAVVTIHGIETMNVNMPHVDLRITCGTGTYVRSIARDLGNTLGIGGAVETLRRVRIGPYHVDGPDVTVLESPVPIAHQDILPDLDALMLQGSELSQLGMGKSVLLKHVELEENLQVRVFSDYLAELMVLCHVQTVSAAGSRIQPEKVLAVVE